MTATLKPAIPSGGIQAQRVENDFSDYVAGRPLTQRVVIAVLQAGSIGADTLERGRVNKVKYETVHLVEIRDPHEADQLRHRITQLRADQGFAAKQPGLFDMSEAEQVDSLKDLIKDYVSAQDLPMAEVDKRWVEYFGGGDNANSETVQASRSVANLKEFAYEIGALGETKPDGEEDAADGETGEDDEPAEDQT